jgi:hypothetical protein
MGIGPKLGYLMLGSSGSLLSYNIIKSITYSNTGTGTGTGTGVASTVSTTISISNSPIIQPGGPTPLHIPSLDSAGKLSGLQESIYSVTQDALNVISQPR